MNSVDNTYLVEEQRQGIWALAAHLEAERGAILQAWLRATEEDPFQNVAASLSRSEFYDHIPQVLGTLNDKLRAWPASETSAQLQTETEVASEHGAHRWQQGYNLQEMAREWALFNVVMVEALDAYGAMHPEVAPEVLTVARRTLAKLTGQSIASSVAEFDRLQRAGAETRARDLESVLGEREGFDRERGALLREASHDLRGGLSVVRGAASLLNDPRLPEDEKGKLVKILQCAGESLHEMLSQMLDLARLEAGREAREVGSFDVAALLLELGESVRPAAEQKGLTLSCQGAETLLVEGDAVKVRRIAQNLLLNAIHYTSSGSVSLSWARHGQGETQWALRVQDSGPGIAQGRGDSLAGELKITTQNSREVGAQSGPAVAFGDALPAPASSANAIGLLKSGEATSPSQGEGVGLMIVKRLCELLDATLELDSKVEEGSLFRVVFPCRYAAPQKESGASPKQ